MYFQQEYLSEKYYDNKMEEFFEFKLGKLTMDAYKKRFIELLTYSYYIKYEKFNIQIFLIGLPTFYKDKIQYDMPKTLKEVIRKGKNCMSWIRIRNIRA